MPLLRVGHHEVANYEAGWLERIIAQAAQAAGHEGWWPAGDVARGIITYLRDRFEANAITLQELFVRIGHTLQNIGFPEIAKAIEAEPPPIELCLRDMAAASEGLELMFFTRLVREVAELRAAGAPEVRVVNLRGAVLALSGNKHWTAGCDALEREVHALVDGLVRETVSSRPFVVRVSH